MNRLATLNLFLMLLPFVGFTQPLNFVTFDGSQSINIPDSKNINDITLTNRTVEFWFRVDDASLVAKQLIYKERGSTRGINFYINEGNLLLGMLSRGSSDTYKWYGTWFRKPIVSNAWYHVALVLRNGHSGDPLREELEFYLNGQLQGKAYGGKLYKDTGDIYLGRNNTTSIPTTDAIWSVNANCEVFEASDNTYVETLGSGSFFKGSIGNFRVWNSARKQQQIVDNVHNLITDLNVAPDNLVAYLYGDYVKYVATDGTTQNTGSNGYAFPSLSPTGIVHNWTGNVDSDWSNPSNWDANGVPNDTADDVVISPSLNNPILATNLTINNLTIEGNSSLLLLNDNTYIYVGGVLTLSDNQGMLSFDGKSNCNLLVVGEIINSGNINISGTTDSRIITSSNFTNEVGAKVLFDNSTSTLNTYIFPDFFVLGNVNNNGNISFDSSSNKVFIINGLFTNSSNGSISYTSSSSCDFYLINDLTNLGSVLIGETTSVTIDGNLDNSNSFTVSSGLDGTGSLITNGTITNTGTFDIQRWLDPANTWQLVSSPLDAEVSNAYYGHFLNWYDEDLGDFNAIAEIDRAFGIAEGLVAKRNSNLSGVAPNPIIYNFGKPNNGDIDITLIPYTGPDDESNTFFHLAKGFNLIGNPYSSNLDWNKIYEANNTVVDATYYRYEDANDGNGTWNPYLWGDASSDSIISMGQGFGVILTGNDTPFVLTIPSNARTHDNGNGFGKNTNKISNSFDLITLSNGLKDRINFRQNPNATNAYDGNYDAYKFNSFGETHNTSFISSDGQRLAICQQPYSESIDLGFSMFTDGEVSFSLLNCQDFPEIILEDKLENKFTDLMKDVYKFNYTVGDPEKGRFTLHFTKKTLDTFDEGFGIVVYSDRNTLILKSETPLNDVVVNVYNTNGKIVLNRNFKSLSNEIIYSNLENGIYVVEVSSKEYRNASKLIINTNL